MITPPVFYAICVAVVSLVGWLYFSRQDIKRSLNEAGNDVARLQGENNRVNGEVERLTAENETLRTEKEEANARIKQLEDANASLVGMNKSLSDDIGTLQDGNEKLIDTQKSLDADLSACQKDLDDVTALNIKLQLKLAGFEQTAAVLKEADARRPELTIRPKFLEGGVRLGLVDQDGKTLMVSPSSYLDLDKARGVMDTIATARVHRGRGVRK